MATKSAKSKFNTVGMETKWKKITREKLNLA